MRILEFSVTDYGSSLAASALGAECTIGLSGGKTFFESDGKIRVIFPEGQKAPEGLEDHPKTELGITERCQRVIQWARKQNLPLISEKVTTPTE